uniref:L-ascorbate oxidase n=1 Tax=Populus alba TaxID=43335 RepID=A0A4U5QPA5_POPAL|nr:hypothetical protein D5086_0000061140 [Populus alba]
MARLSHSIAILTKLQVSCIFILLTTVIPNVEATTHNLTWKVAYEYKYLDCFKKLAIAINGQTPGPHINAETPSHYEDREIILSDWYHDSAYEHAVKLSSKPYVWIGEPQSLLINGRGRYQCELLGVSNRDQCNGSSTECSPDVVKVKPKQTYRFRIASLTSLSALSFQIEGHKMTVVETDGVHVVPFVTDNLYIYSGETYSVLVTTDQNHSRNYGISINVIARKPETPNGFAILNYEPNPVDAQHLPQPPPGPLWNDTDSQRNQSLAIKGLPGYVPAPPRTADKVLHLLNTQNTVNGYKVWAVNNVSHALPDTPYLVALRLNIPDVFDPTPAPEDYDHSYNIYEIPENTNATTSTSIYRLPFNKTVDIILQNAKSMGGDSETHPWHLHGHNFWVLGFGKDKFNPSTASLNLENPIMKNTVPLFPYGWTALRFRTDNPGIWLFHCHIEAHFYLGMLVLFESGSDMVTKPPQQNMGCGKTKNYINP